MTDPSTQITKLKADLENVLNAFDVSDLVDKPQALEVLAKSFQILHHSVQKTMQMDIEKDLKEACTNVDDVLRFPFPDEGMTLIEAAGKFDPKKAKTSPFHNILANAEESDTILRVFAGLKAALWTVG